MINEAALAGCLVLDEYGFAVEGAEPALADAATPETSVFRFSARLERDRRYTIVIAPDIFGNREWEESKGLLGETNPQIVHKFVPSELNGGGNVDGIVAVTATAGTAGRDVYSATGMLLRRNATEADVDALPAGLYIVGGRKVAKR